MGSSQDAEKSVLAILEEFSGVPGVRGTLLSRASGVVGEAKYSGLELETAEQLAKTARRMVVTSTSAGAAIENLVINFGAIRTLIAPMRDEAILIFLLEQDAGTASLLSLLELESEELSENLALMA